jgi:hypothetical protein
MRRILPLLTLGLVALVVTDRIGKTMHTEQVSQGASTAVPAHSAAVQHPNAPVPPPADGRSATVPASTVSTVDRLARLAVRQQLRRLQAGTYIDSLIVTTDSVVRRWPDRAGAPLRVFVIQGGAPGFDPHMAALVHEAVTRWDELNLGITFSDAPDSASADITVRWIDRFSIERAGQTDLTWDQSGQVHHAAISLALRTNAGIVLPAPAMLAVAIHEMGHAIGLPHSADSTDVMFPATQVNVLSERDRRTAQVLYRLPLGPLRDDAPNAR